MVAIISLAAGDLQNYMIMGAHPCNDEVSTQPVFGLWKHGE